MTTCRDIITLGMNLAAILPMGRTPKAKEAEFGMTILQSMYDQLVADQIFGALTEVYTDIDYTAKEYESIYSAGATITIPDTIEDSCTGKTRTPRDLACIVVESNSGREVSVFNGNSWEVLNDLTLDSDAPLATRNKAGLAALFALYFVDAFGGALGQMTRRNALLFQGGLSAARKDAAPEPAYY